MPDAPDGGFPDVAAALERPNGLLAFGGDLCPTRLLDAYAHGIFPWFSEGQPILWWSPDPRLVFRSDGVHLSTRFRRQLRRSRWTIRADTAFEQVINACAASPRSGQSGTWITSAMGDAYLALHRMGHAHSVEVFDADALVGGIYGVAVGQMFFGESMFSARSGGSKVALAALAKGLHHRDWPLIDAQVSNDHLLSLGARPMPRSAFIDSVSRLSALPGLRGSWTDDFEVSTAAALS